MRVLLIDDHEIVWRGTQHMLERLAVEVSQGQPIQFTAVRTIGDSLTRPRDAFDLILLDYHLPDLSGLPALVAVRGHFEGVPVCVQSAESDARKVRELVEAGAAGFVPKSYRLEEMEAALRIVLMHRVYLPAEFVLVEDSTRERLPDEVTSEDLARFLGTELSGRQRQVLALAVQGQPVKLIARQLSIAEGTVKVHLSMVYRALGVRNRTDALCRVFKAQAAESLGIR